MKYLAIIFSVFLFVNSLNAQQIDKITRRCPSPNTNVYSSVLVTRSGDVTHLPCPARSSIFTGNVDFSNAIVAGFSSVSISTDEIISQNNLLISATDITAFGVGIARFGGNNASLIMTQATSTFKFNSGTTIDTTDTPLLMLNRTITPSGTTGNQTIHNAAGTVNFAAGQSDIVVTNAIVNANSIILCTVQSLDATAISCRITDKAVGSFHIRVPATTAETSVGFLVTN